MDRISIAGIDVYAYHGVHPAERELGQRFVVDVDLWADLAQAARTDSLRHLLEALALRLCRALLAEFPLERVAVTVQKPNPPIANFLGRVAVTLERDRALLEAADEPGPL